jgi:murein DD-endopeptidase MepM/ murein hydrolase activator NlpD
MNIVSLILLFANAISAQQGQALRLSLPNEPGIQSVEIQWQNHKIPYVQTGEQWVAVIGVDLDVKPGEYPSELKVTRNGSVDRRSVTVEVQKVEYPTTQLKVADAYVQLSPANQARAAREAKEIEEIHNTITPSILWTEAFKSPIAGEKGTNFGHRRIFNGEPRAPHGGADLKAATGTPIHSSNKGRVVLAKDLFFTGNTVIVDHGLGIYTLYAHLSRIDVKKGTIVERGQIVGLSGATGRVTGPHLHWGARVQNARVDPFSLVNLAW